MTGATRSLPLFEGLRKTEYSLSYCGLCKTIGKVYSQRSRFALSRDIVFLLECLTDAKEKERYASLPGFSSANCFRAPGEEQLDAKYRYCAAVNLLAASYRIEDDIEDENSLKAKFARRALGSDIRSARADLAATGFPLEASDGAISDLHEIEQRSPADKNAVTESALEYAAPIERLYGLVYRHGAELTGKDADRFEELGRLLGRATYLLDAIKDLEADRKKGRPNPLLEGGDDEATLERAAAIVCDALGLAAGLVGEVQPVESRAKTLRSLLPAIPGSACFSPRSGRWSRVLSRTADWYRDRCQGVLGPRPVAIVVKLALLAMLPFVFVGNAFAASTVVASNCTCPCWPGAENSCCGDEGCCSGSGLDDCGRSATGCAAVCCCLGGLVGALMCALLGKICCGGKFAEGVREAKEAERRGSNRLFRVARDGVELCEGDSDAILEKLRAGELRETDFGWTEGMEEWVPLAEMLPDADDREDQ